MTREEKNAIRLIVYEEANECCEQCGIGLVFESGSWSSMHLHHIKTRGSGGDWNRINLKCLCIAMSSCQPDALTEGSSGRKASLISLGAFPYGYIP